jgi:hypothetical protein
MTFVDLKRSFVPVNKDEEASLSIGDQLGQRYGGWLSWAGLLERKRVVLLAEALSGKSEEFKHAASSLRAKGSFAFDTTVENLVDQAFLVKPDEQAALDRWKAGDEVAWFFLDSVDEARLNRKRLKDALLRLAACVGPALGRARILVSCRVSDWQGEPDRTTILSILPLPKEAPATAQSDDPDAALLDPFFAQEEQRGTGSKKDETETVPDLTVVRLVPLNDDQRRMLTQAEEFPDVDVFLKAIEQHGLDTLAERPGDVLELIRYWKTHGGFGSLLQMTEETVKVKLAEIDPYRPDNADLTQEEARQGSERLAAGLTLVKSFTLAGPGGAADPSLAAGAVKANDLFSDWVTPKISALLRRGIFAPATYGRVRFHHRSTQEYLTAKWLHRILEAGCDPAEIFNLLFAVSYGVKTVVPSLRATAAWLALWCTDIRDEIVDRDPMLLLKEGDPGSLPDEIKSKLLLHVARRHADGDVADDSIDRRALWMFATPSLSDAIHKAWEINQRPDFRADLIRLVREGGIKGCVDLAIALANDEKARDYWRVLAVDALVACQADRELKVIAKSFIRIAPRARPQHAAGFSKALFPNYISVKQLFEIIEKTKPAKRFATDGFSYEIDSLFDACPAADKSEFIDRLAALCLKQPFAEDFRRVSRQQVELAKHLGSVAHAGVTALRGGTPSQGLVKLLSVVERAERGSHRQNEQPPLNTLVRENVSVNRALFWYDVEEVRQFHKKKGQQVDHRLYIGGAALWGLADRDRAWLELDLATKPFEDDRRVALSAITDLLGGELKTYAPELRKLIGKNAALRADLQQKLKPPKPSAAYRKSQADHAVWERKTSAKRERDKESWRKFRDKIIANPQVLSRVINAEEAPVGWLLNLTTWLAKKTGKEHATGAPNWQLLEPAFSRAVAENYRDGMKALWRVVEPESPVRKEGGTTTVKWVTILSVAGLNIEASEDPKFEDSLTSEEIRRAALHGAVSGQGYPLWMDALLNNDPATVVPIARNEFAREWSGDGTSTNYFLHHFSNENEAIHPGLRDAMLEIIVGHEPATLNLLDRGIDILLREPFVPHQIERVRAVAEARFTVHQTKPEWASRYLGVLFFIDFARTARKLTAWVEAPKEAERYKLTETVLGIVFGDRDAVAGRTLWGAPVSSLERLLLLAYRYISPARDLTSDDDDDDEEEEDHSWRDDAERARHAILKALTDSRGVEAYDTMLQLATHRAMKPRRLWFRELARQMADRDSELPAWTPGEVIGFERDRLLPPKTGAQLFRVAQSVLNHINWRFDHGNSSSQPVLFTAKDEEAVQKYLAEQLDLTARDRYHIAREPEIAESNKPDILLSSAHSIDEVAIEVKYGDKGWRALTLEHALSAQLAEDYLRPSNRRHGLLVITNHSSKRWKHPTTGKMLSFTEMITYLNTVAVKLKRNAVGEVTVAAIGIDAMPRKRTRKAPKKVSVTKDSGSKTKARRKR